MADEILDSNREKPSEVVEERRCKTCTNYTLHYNTSPCRECIDHALWLPRFAKEPLEPKETEAKVDEKLSCKKCVYASGCNKVLAVNGFCDGYERKDEKPKKVKLKLSEKKLKYLQEIICDKCMKCDEECNEPCNLSRYIKKERE